MSGKQCYLKHVQHLMSYKQDYNKCNQHNYGVGKIVRKQRKKQMNRNEQ